MDNILFFERKERENFYPLTLTRSIAELRMGILTLRKKWETILSKTSSTLTVPYLQKAYLTEITDDNLLINGSLLPSLSSIDIVKSLDKGEALLYNSQILALRINKEETLSFQHLIHHEEEMDILSVLPTLKKIVTPKEISILKRPSDIFSLNAQEIKSDFAMITAGRSSFNISKTNLLIGPSENLFVEDGVRIEGAIINTEEGPVYIGEGATIMEGAVLKGPLSIGEHSVVESCCRISQGTTIGPWCKVGGEIKNSVFLAYSNKAHDGFLGNSLIGEWCNIGAGSNFSNLQNNYKSVRQWHYPEQKFLDTGLQFCGIVMGDHNKCSIGSVFNTGTVTGICCNLFGEGFHNRLIPSFSYGGKTSGYCDNQIDKIIDTAIVAQKRRNLEMKKTEIDLLKYLFENRKTLHL